MLKNAPYASGSVAGGVGVMSMDYLGGFQYQGTALKFFPTAEGYVQATALKVGFAYSYVYNYMDHLGNIRLSYAQDPENPNVLKILEESHYYPFGLKHANYNSDQLAFREKDPGPGLMLMAAAAAVDPVPQFVYNYKFQGQERQDEMGLNWDSFKWRNYDYAIGRFMNIDPLAEKYNTWSPYVFSGNRVIDARELEGLEPHSPHKSLEEAGNNFVSQYNGLSIRMKGEIGTNFYSKVINGETVYSYIQPVGSPNGKIIDADSGIDKIPSDATLVGKGHTHMEDKNIIQFDKKGKMISNESNMFSEQDLDVADNIKKDNSTFEGMIVGTPNGKALIYTPNGETGEKRNKDIKRTSNQMPSDPSSATRANEISPNSLPEVLPYGTSQEDVDNLPKL